MRGGQDRRQPAPDNLFSLLGFIPLKSRQFCLCQDVKTYFVSKSSLHANFSTLSLLSHFGLWLGKIHGRDSWSSGAIQLESSAEVLSVGYTCRSCVRVLKCCCAEEASLGIIPVRRVVTRVSLSLLPGHRY